MYLVGKEYEEYQQLKAEMSGVDSERTVKRWNSLRDIFKNRYSRVAIYMLDASGYIKKWLKGN